MFVSASAERVTRLVERSNSSGISVYSSGPLPKSTAEGLTFRAENKMPVYYQAPASFPQWRWRMKYGKQFMRVDHCQRARRVSFDSTSTTDGYGDVNKHYHVPGTRLEPRR